MLLSCPCSIALDPLYPSRCSWETFGYATSTTMTHVSDELTPLQLSGQLNSLPCSMSFRQEESTSIIRLIEQVSQAYPLSSIHPAACSSQRAKPGAHVSIHIELPTVSCQHQLFSCLLSFCSGSTTAMLFLPGPAGPRCRGWFGNGALWQQNMNIVQLDEV